MQSQFIEDEPIDVPELILNTGTNVGESENFVETEAPSAIAPMCFQSRFEDCMELYADVETVAKYFAAHNEWFCRCAQPMKADPLGANGYALTIGKFGSFGYEVEPKIGLELLPPDEKGMYRTRTIPVPGYVAPGYEVDYNAAMWFVEVPAGDSILTRVEWQLDLAVHINFPKFIYKLSKSLLQKTGDRVLCQIVRQVSRCLTAKVQQDFHSSLGITLPKKSHKRAA